MDIAIVHYHLQPGGVTRVIGHAAQALTAMGHRVVVLASAPPQEPTEYTVCVVHALRYTLPNEKIDAGALTFEMKRAARQIFGGEPDIWHIHNHSLGKNSAMPEVAGKLAMERPVVLQIHDFAEDGRPQNYAMLRAQLADISRLYPAAPQIHYATLNGRDAEVLREAGLPESNLHRLPNAISVPEIPGDAPVIPEAEGRKLVLYPTRGIRRKNLGEFLLQAALYGDDYRFGATLSPANPTARPVYDRWVAFGAEKQIPALFGLGEGDHSFGGLMAAAESIVTTSVAEGFGLAFLEPWLFGKPLRGRNLPEITDDFHRDGVSLDGLYSRVDVPLDWVGEEALRSALAEGIREVYTAYDVNIPEDAVDRALGASCRHGMVDFARLNEPLQEAVISRLVDDPGASDAIRTDRPGYMGGDIITGNRQAIEGNFNLASYGERLLRIYAAAAHSERGDVGALNWFHVLRAFLQPERFFLLRT